MRNSNSRVLVTGATGCVGGALVPELVRAGHTVRVIARNPEDLTGRPWADDVEILRADASSHAELRAALVDIDVAYYLIHSLESAIGFEETERAHARTFAKAARGAGISRLVYLGGLVPPDARLSSHLSSRREVGHILAASGVPTTILRAGIIVGAASASFQMLRELTEQLPVLVGPWWLKNRVQPIAIRDMLHYLVAAAHLPAHVGGAFDVGGPDVLSYRELIQRYAAAAGLGPRLVLRSPFVTPGLASVGIGLLTAVPTGLAYPLVESLAHNMVCSDDNAIAEHIDEPRGGPTGFDEAVRLTST